MPALAYADTDSYVELQFDAGAVGDLIRRELATQSTFCPQATVTPDGSRGYVDHLEFNQVGRFLRAPSVSGVAINSFTRVESKEVLYTLPVDVHFKTSECASDPECATTKPVAATLTYALYMSSTSQLCMESYDSSGLPEGVAPPEVIVCLPFDADFAMKAAGMKGGTASGNAVSLSTDGTRLAARIELGRTQEDYDRTRIEAWQAFADGEIEATGAKNDWSVFTHKSLILGAVQQRLAEALASQVGFRIDGAVETSWVDLGDSGAQVSARLNGVLYDSICPNDIRVNNIMISGLVGQNAGDSPTGLLTEGSVTYDVSDFDAALCGLALGGPVGALVLASVADSMDLGLPDLGPSCAVDDDFKFSCDQVTHPQLASVGPLQVAHADLAGVVGSATGLTMNGSVKTVGSSLLTMKGRTSPFSREETTAAYEGGLQVVGTGNLCGVNFWADHGGDVGLFDIAKPSIAGLPAYYKVSLPSSNAREYARNPFHLMATVMTSAGVHTYQFDLVGP